MVTVAIETKENEMKTERFQIVENEIVCSDGCCLKSKWETMDIETALDRLQAGDDSDEVAEDAHGEWVF